MYDELSPEAQEARREAGARHRTWWPRLGRTEDKLVLMHPLNGGHKARRALARYVAAQLPAFKWNSKLARWEAPLDAETLQATAEAFTQVGEVQLNLSDGVREML